MASTDIIAYSADASMLHTRCAIRRYTSKRYCKPYRDHGNTVDEYGRLYGTDSEGNTIEPIFAYESHNVQGDVCDACMQPIVDS